jgi:hypothetical protein
VELSRGNPAIAASLGEAYASAGRTAEARLILTELIALSERRYVSPWSLFLLNLAVGEMDRAFEWLEKCYEERTNGIAYVGVHFRCDVSARTLAGRT